MARKAVPRCVEVTPELAVGLCPLLLAPKPVCVMHLQVAFPSGIDPANWNWPRLPILLQEYGRVYSLVQVQYGQKAAKISFRFSGASVDSTYGRLLGVWPIEKRVSGPIEACAPV